MQKVVVLGGGYAGVHAVRTLAKNRSIEIVLIDKHTYHNLQPEVYNYIASKSDLTDVTVDLYTLCEGIEHPRLSFMNKRVVDCDL
ncbi:MAG: FAD-dependent oxidoreductase, partial [Thiovulaceae bacterium]|nr:FAD-dependent oxidoreductase [Sulfurimonadaceae bacterium]